MQRAEGTSAGHSLGKLRCPYRACSRTKIAVFFGQIHLPICNNISRDLEKYILQLGQIHLQIEFAYREQVQMWRKIEMPLPCLLPYQDCSILWTNTFSNLQQYISQFGEIHLTIRTNTFANRVCIRRASTDVTENWDAPMVLASIQRLQHSLTFFLIGGRGRGCRRMWILHS